VIALTFASVVAAPPDAVWRHATTMEGVNDELRPLVRMTAPQGTIDDLPLGEPAFRSVLLAGGLIPFDVHFLCVDELEEGRFLERSRSLLQRRWEHERTVEAAPGGARVTDRLRIEPRLRLAVPLVRRMAAATFRHRHRRLARRFGAVSATAAGR
jgi:ligand-binding SRPBCC domain-containing protein